jgi:uncharacterized protein YhfF
MSIPNLLLMNPWGPKDEGEGDLSLEYWRKAHWRFFTREAITEGYEVSDDMLLSCERFRVLYRNPDRQT